MVDFNRREMVAAIAAGAGAAYFLSDRMPKVEGEDARPQQAQTAKDGPKAVIQIWLSEEGRNGRSVVRRLHLYSMYVDDLVGEIMSRINQEVAYSEFELADRVHSAGVSFRHINESDTAYRRLSWDDCSFAEFVGALLDHGREDIRSLIQGVSDIKRNCKKAEGS